jgi:hypothetical protein
MKEMTSSTAFDAADCQNDLPHRAISFAAMMEICQLALLAGLSDFVPFKHGRKI